MAAAVAPKLADIDPALLARLGVLQGTGALAPARAALPLGWPELDRALPDRGLPRGVVELASNTNVKGSSERRACLGPMRGGATTIALAAVRAVHASDARAFCAWISPTDTPRIYAPAAAAAGVDLDRLLVVRPEPGALARTAIKVGTSGAFELVVIDALRSLRSFEGRRSKAHDPSLVVRKLALASEETGTTFLLVTSAYAPRRAPWPVALRLEVERRPEAIALRVTKDRNGRASVHGDALRSSHHVVRIAC